MAHRFETTRWSVVRSARDREDTEGCKALESLCEAYWEPLWAFARRRGYSSDEAGDLTQGYFSVLLEKGYLSDVKGPSAGRFRSFLLTSFKHYVYNEYDRAKTLKRGGAFTHFSLDSEEAQYRYECIPTAELSPDAVYERRWAELVIQRSLDRLRERSKKAGNAKRFEKLSGYLVGGDGQPYGEVAESLGMSEEAVKVAVHRLRKKLGKLLREEVAGTVSSSSDVDAELRHLLEVVS